MSNLKNQLTYDKYTIPDSAEIFIVLSGNSEEPIQRVAITYVFLSKDGGRTPEMKQPAIITPEQRTDLESLLSAVVAATSADVEADGYVRHIEVSA